MTAALLLTENISAMIEPAEADFPQQKNGWLIMNNWEAIIKAIDRFVDENTLIVLDCDNNLISQNGLVSESVPDALNRWRNLGAGVLLETAGISMCSKDIHIIRPLVMNEYKFHFSSNSLHQPEETEQVSFQPIGIDDTIRGKNIHVDILRVYSMGMAVYDGKDVSGFVRKDLLYDVDSKNGIIYTSCTETVIKETVSEEKKYSDIYGYDSQNKRSGALKGPVIFNMMYCGILPLFSKLVIVDDQPLEILSFAWLENMLSRCDYPIPMLRILNISCY
jgi:hypothetical protein